MTTFLSDIILSSANDIQFKNSAGTNTGKIESDGNNLVLSNAVGDILLGDGASDVYIGDGTNNVDILFEQSGSKKADDSATGVTITLGSSNTTIAFGGAVSFGGSVSSFSAGSANTVDLGASATPFLNLYTAHHVGGNSINYATSRGWVEDSAPLSSTQVGEFGGNFVRNGEAAENAVVRGQDPFNNKALLWKAIGNTSDDDADGGWNKDITIPANNDIGYLSYVYFKADFTADSSEDGTIYLGCGTTSGQTINISDDSSNTNPYFVSNNLHTVNNGSAVVANRWYLMIGVIQPYNDETTGTDTISGVYDVETGEKVLNGSEFKMGNNTTGQRHRTYLYYQDSNSAGNVYFWNPGFHAIDGSEPKLQDLLKRQTIANTVKVGRDGHNLIDFTTDNQIDFRVADGNRLRLTQTALAPITTDTVSLGTSSLNFSDLFLDSGGVINFDASDVTLTHSGNNLAIAGGNLEFTGYGFVMDGVTITGVDNDGEFTDDNSHIMTSAAINDRFAQINADTTGTAENANHANNLNATDDRDMAPEDYGYANDLRIFFSSKEGLEDGSSSGSNYQDVLYLNSYSDASGGDANILAFDKSEMKIYHYQADQAATNWGTAKEIAYTASPTFTGTPAAPTAGAGTNTTQLATTAFVTTAVSNLVDSAPGTLNTLNELAAALGDDASFSTTVTNSIAAKLPLAGGTMTGDIAMGNNDISGSGTVLGTSAKFGRDADNLIDFTTDNEIQFRVGANHELIVNANQIHPTSDDGIALGYAGRGFSDLFLASGSVINFNSGDVTVTHSSNKLTFDGASAIQINTPAANSTSQNLILNRPAAGSHYSSIEWHTDGTVDWSIGQNSADNFEIFENGADATTRFTIEEGGNIGIGVTDPTQKLHVDGHALISGEKYYYVNGTGAGVGSDSSGNLILRQNSADLMTTSGSNATFAGTLTVSGADAITIPDYILHAGDDSKFGFPSNDNFKVRLAGSDVLTISTSVMSFTGEVEGGSLDINGNADISGNVTLSGDNPALTLNDSNGRAAALDVVGNTFRIDDVGNNAAVMTADLSVNPPTLSLAGAVSCGGTLTVAGNLTANGNIIGDDSTNITNIASIGADSYGSDADSTTRFDLTADEMLFLIQDEDIFSSTLTDFLISVNAKIPKRKFTKTTNTDANADGDIVYFGSTTSMDAGKIYYLNSSGNWALADASAESTAKGMLGVALGTASDTNGVLIRGMVTLDHDRGTIGDTVFLSTTAGQASSTAPSGNGDIVRVIGYCLDSTNGQIYFNPDGTFVEVTA